MGELYGETNPNTLEWTDGLLASAVRKFAKEDVIHGMEDQSVDARSSTAMSGTQSRGRSSVTGVSLSCNVCGNLKVDALWFGF